MATPPVTLRWSRRFTGRPSIAGTAGLSLSPRHAIWATTHAALQACTAQESLRTVWPELDVVCCARRQELGDYVASLGDESRVLNVLVGDTLRLWVYADARFAIPVDVPAEVRAAHNRLVAVGYTNGMENSPESERKLMGLFSPEPVSSPRPISTTSGAPTPP